MTENTDTTPSSLSVELQQRSSVVERKQLIESLAANHPEDPETIPALLAELRPDGNEIINWAIIRALGKLKAQQPEVIASLLTLLERGRPPSRGVVAGILPLIARGNQEVIEALAQLVDRDPNQDLYPYIAQVLAGIGKDNQVARDILIQMIYHSSNTDTLRMISGALRKVDSGSPEAIHAWLHIVQTGETYYVRYPAMSYLGQVAVGNPLVIETFKAMIQTQGTDRWSQDSRTIGGMGLQEVNRTLLSTEADGVSVNELEGVSLEEFFRNQEQKGVYTNPENIEIFLELLAKSPTEDDQRNAVVQLTQLGKGHPRIIERFLDLIPNHRQGSLDHLLVSGLLKIVTEDIPEELKDRVAQVATQELQIRDPENFSKSLFGNILGKIGRATAEVVEPIARMIREREDHWEVWVDSLVSMQPLGRQEAIHLLNSSDDQNLLIGIVVSLQRQRVEIEDPSVVDAFVRLTQRSNPMSVGLGLHALERLGSRESRILEAITTVSESHEDPEIRQMAVNALATLREQPAG